MAAKGALQTFLFTSESVNEGHPDKLCDQVNNSSKVDLAFGTPWIFSALFYAVDLIRSLCRPNCPLTFAEYLCTGVRCHPRCLP